VSTDAARQFLVADTWLGQLLVAAGETGVCWASLGDDAEQLEGELRAAFPEVEAGVGSAGEEHGALSGWAERIIALLDGRERDIDVPLYVRGSLFQRRVWWALKSIPYGKTKSYGEIARSLGVDVAPRAVARACAANTLAVVIPCHRAVGQDGDLTGYRWGRGRKRLLLERERQVSGEPTQMALL
jgi:AraC family transcriptional regulator of adaptative response/methylated-DNA-[protein]-cysteine methyltransferase